MTEETTDMNQLVRALLSRVEKLEAQVLLLRAQGHGQSATAGGAGERSLNRTAGAENATISEDVSSLFQSENVVPPTPSDDPDFIVGGAPTGLFPDCCAVGNDSAFFCTGTLIAPNLVVTAKHCDTVSRVFLKGRDISFLPAGEVIRVKRQIPHETADIQVLVLETDSTVKPRHVARTNEVDTPSLATVVGFGTVNFDGTSGFGLKRRVTVPIMSLDCSSQEDQNDFRCVAETEIVAGHRGLWKDTCKGDSGGPLYIQGPGGQFFLLGATSRGTGEPGPICGQGGIYVRLDKFVDWIRKETNITPE